VSIVATILIDALQRICACVSIAAALQRIANAFFRKYI
jgi:hypothetical protein